MEPRTPQRTNLSFTKWECCSPTSKTEYIERDRERLDWIIKNGSLPQITWLLVKKEYQRHLSKLLGRDVAISFVDVSDPPKHDSGFETELVSLDQKMEKERADGCVVHGKNL